MTSMHPLDLIPYFRRWPGSPARNLLYTGIWNTLLALFLVVVNRMFSERSGTFWADLYPSLVLSNTIGYLIHGAMTVASPLLQAWPARARGLPRLLFYVVLVAGCVVLGTVLGSALLKGVNPLHYMTRGAAMTLLPFALFTAIFMFAVFVLGERRIATETLALRQREQIASAAQLVAEARLRSLQAQIEPHFLYNTLANVVGMIDTRPTQARHMLERFIDYLRASLDASRADSATLGAELDLVAAYLDVLAVRMGPRLRYRYEIEAGCRDIVIAPMLLQPVVENAVAHGLEPKVEGGEIVLRASRQHGQLLIEVSDTGAGLSGAPVKPGGGVGLSNLRARLRSLYHGAAQVQLLENQPCGITLRIVLPLTESLPSTNPAP
ncbi:sensor histidine kinase [Massilia sp. TSP1-1-2]|uniref:sensor histidine kinase n=1 Tax=Massilia sp. TSP1-1-2 TaxID=2804649 RepID=UPI003CE82E31